MKRGILFIPIIISLFISGCVFLQQPIGPLNLEQAEQRIGDCSSEALTFIEINDDTVSTIRPALNGNFLVYGKKSEDGDLAVANIIPSETRFSDGSYTVTITTDYGQRREYTLTPDRMDCNNFWSVSTRIPNLYNLYKIIGTGKYIIDINSPSHVLTIEGSLSQGCDVYKDGSTTVDNIPTAFSNDGINWLLVSEEYPQNQNPLVGKVIVNTNSPSCIYTAKIKTPKKTADNLEFEEFELTNPQEIEEVKN